VTNPGSDIVRQAIDEEIRPVVREAITQEVMENIQTLLGLTPSAIAAIKEDLEGNDAALRHKAATLLLKYTLGNPSVAPEPDRDDTKNLQVNFTMPRPGDEVAVEVDADEVKQCDSCGIDKPLGDFIGASDRCRECFDKAKELAASLSDAD